VFALLFHMAGMMLMVEAAEMPEKSTQFGTERINIVVNGRQGFVLMPTGEAPDGLKPWVWYAPTFAGSLPSESRGHEWLFERLLASGFSICGVDVGDSHGNPEGRKVYDAFHKKVVKEYGLSPKACLLPQSRGGLMLYNWAAEHPKCVKCIGGIYAVCDMESWPGLAEACVAYGMTEDELRAHLSEHNPIDRLAPLAEEDVPILHLHGDRDEAVPLEKNSAELARRYRALGGRMEVVVIKGKGHEEVREYFESQELLDFFLSHGLDSGDKEGVEGAT